VQINDALIGNVNFQGLWNAATNTPTLANPPASGTKGYYYIVSTAGTFAGISFEVGDWIISDGTAWGKVDNTDAVSSVFGRTGNVTATNGDYNTSQVTENTNLYYTEARVNANTNVAANTAARHNAVTLGTANGLSLSTQVLSLQLATSGQNGALSSTDWTTFNNKENAITAGTTAQYYRGDKTFQTLNTGVVPESGNLYFTNARAIASVLTGYTSGAGTISATDTILSAIQKLNGNIGALTTGVSSVNGQTGVVVLTTTNIAEGTNLYYTEARVNANTNVAANTAARHAAVTLGTANGLSLSTQQLSLGLASAGVTGALSGTDWSTFNSKQNALTNPVTGTGNTNYLAKFTSNGSTIGNSLVFDNGSSVGINTITPSLQGFNNELTISSGTSGTSRTALNLQGSRTTASTFASIAFYHQANFVASIESSRGGADNSGNLQFFTTNAGTTGERLTIAPTGEATFSSSVTAGGTITNQTSGGDAILYAKNGTVTAILIANTTGELMGIGGTESNHPYIIRTGNTERMRITSTGAAIFLSSVTATSIIRSGGTSSQFLKADGSVDSNSYYLASNPSAFIALTALSGTAPIQYNNTTGAISITQSSGSTNGFLSSTDWNTFNNKTSNVGTVTSVAALTLGTTGTDLSSSVANGTTTPVITLNVPTASAANRGALSAADWTTFNGKENAITAGTTAQYYRGDKTFQTLNTAAVPELTNLYYTEARVSANTDVAANTAARHNAVTLGTANGLSLSTQQLSLGLASSSANGALSSTDWTTFNNKQNALTNPVTGTGTTNYLPKFTGASTIGNSLVFDNGSVVSIGTNATLVQTLNINETYASQSLNSTSGNFAYIGLLNGATGGAFNLAVEGSSGGTFGTGTTAYAGVLSRLGSYNLQFATNNIVRATIDPSGNLGLGVTPSAWSPTLAKAIQFGNLGSSIWSYTTANTSTPYTFIDNNAYYNGTNDIYIVNNRGAARYLQVNNEHIWYTAPSGTAGNAISFTQAMTLGSNSGLSIGTPSAAPSQGLLVQGAATLSSNLAVNGNKITLGSQEDIVSTSGLLLGSGFSTIEMVGSNFAAGYGAKIEQADPGDGFTYTRLFGRANTTSWTQHFQVNNTTGAATFSSSIAATSATFTGNLTVDTNTLFVDSTNNSVGIGTLIPKFQSFNRELTVSGGTSGTSRGAINIQGSRTTNSTFGSFAFFHQTNYVAGIESSRAGADNSGNLQFFTTNGGVTGERLTISSTGEATFSSSVTATSFIRSGGTSSQYLMADGSVSTLTNPVTGTGSGTTNTIPKFTGANALGNSIITDSGSLVSIDGNFRIRNSNGFNDSVNFDRTAINGLILNSSGNLILNGSTGSSRITCYGDGYFSGGVQTGLTTGASSSSIWLLGQARGGTVTTNATVRVEIGGVLVDLVARYV
jgi:hypothetical protein